MARRPDYWSCLRLSCNQFCPDIIGQAKLFVFQLARNRILLQRLKQVSMRQRRILNYAAQYPSLIESATKKSLCWPCSLQAPFLAAYVGIGTQAQRQHDGRHHVYPFCQVGRTILSLAPTSSIRHRAAPHAAAAHRGEIRVAHGAPRISGRAQEMDRYLHRMRRYRSHVGAVET
jgi:hypothetical protein